MKRPRAQLIDKLTLSYIFASVPNTFAQACAGLALPFLSAGRAARLRGALVHAGVST
jgi:hypothetical protein